jgi:hypothetical protein
MVPGIFFFLTFLLRFPPFDESVYNAHMTRHATPRSRTHRRRPSRLSGWLASQKIEEARRMTPEERLRLALELSDACFELKLACSSKR